MAAQAVLSGLRLSLGALGSPLWCHQRLDLSNLSSSLSLVGTFAVLWIGFHLGWHVYSLTVSSVAGTFLGSFTIYLFCRRLGLYPPREHRGRYDPQLFRELFHFGGGLFLMNLGAQLSSASQVILVSRLLGMEAAATWSVATKIFSMAQQFVSRVLDSSAGGLAEMVVRKESGQLQKRFRDLVAISAVMAVAASAGIALMNGAFIEIWTSGKVTWNPWNNLLLACVLFSTAVTRCHISLTGLTKQLRGMKFVYLLEGIAFVSLSVLLVPWAGFTGLLFAALLCNIAITANYGVARTASYFGITWREVIDWIARPAGILLLAGALFIITRLHIVAAISAPLRLGVGAGAFCIFVMPSMWFFGINPDLRLELTRLFAKFWEKARTSLRMT